MTENSANLYIYRNSIFFFWNCFHVFFPLNPAIHRLPECIFHIEHFFSRCWKQIAVCNHYPVSSVQFSTVEAKDVLHHFKNPFRSCKPTENIKFLPAWNGSARAKLLIQKFFILWRFGRICISFSLSSDLYHVLCVVCRLFSSVRLSRKMIVWFQISEIFCCSSLELPAIHLKLEP